MYYLPRGGVVVINGFPGVGKLTIARRLVQSLQNLDTRLIDNHLLVDPAHALFPDRSPEHNTLRLQLRTPFFQSIRQIAGKGDVVIMTACLSAYELAMMREHLDIVRGTDIPMYWINCFCRSDTLQSRVASTERVDDSRTKLTDASVIQRIVDEIMMRLLPSYIENEADKMMNVMVKEVDVSGSLEDSVAAVLQIIAQPLGKDR